MTYPDGSTTSFGDPFPSAIRQMVYEISKMDALMQAEGWLLQTVEGEA